MSTARKENATHFRICAPEQKGGFGVARPVRAKHSEAARHAGRVVQRAYKEALKELAKV